MRTNLQKIIMVITCACMFTSCSIRSGQEADWTKLWLITQTFWQEQTRLHHNNQAYLNQLATRTKSRRRNTYKRLVDLDRVLYKQLVMLDMIADSVYKTVRKPDWALATQFVKAGDKSVAVLTLRKQLGSVIGFEDSLFKQYPKILSGKPKATNTLQCLISTDRRISWAIAYADLMQWKCELLRKEGLVFEQQGYAFVKPPFYKLLPEFYLETSQEAQEVMEGDDYKATMFLNHVASKAKPRIRVNGRPVPVYFGRGLVRFRPKKTGTFEWKGEITFKSKGRDTTFTVMTQYRVIPK